MPDGTTHHFLPLCAPLRVLLTPPPPVGVGVYFLKVNPTLWPFGGGIKGSGGPAALQSFGHPKKWTARRTGCIFIHFTYILPLSHRHTLKTHASFAPAESETPNQTAGNRRTASFSPIQWLQTSSSQADLLKGLHRFWSGSDRLPCRQ